MCRLCRRHLHLFLHVSNQITLRQWLRICSHSEHSEHSDGEASPFQPPAVSCAVCREVLSQGVRTASLSHGCHGRHGLRLSMPQFKKGFQMLSEQLHPTLSMLLLSHLPCGMPEVFPEASCILQLLFWTELDSTDSLPRGFPHGSRALLCNWTGTVSLTPRRQEVEL